MHEIPIRLSIQNVLFEKYNETYSRAMIKAFVKHAIVSKRIVYECTEVFLWKRISLTLLILLNKYMKRWMGILYMLACYLYWCYGQKSFTFLAMVNRMECLVNKELRTFKWDLSKLNEMEWNELSVTKSWFTFKWLSLFSSHHDLTALLVIVKSKILLREAYNHVSK